MFGIHLGWHYRYAGHTLEMDPAFPQAQRYAAWAYLQKGMHTTAASQAAFKSLGRDPEIEGELAHALGGRPAKPKLETCLRV